MSTQAVIAFLATSSLWVCEEGMTLGAYGQPF